MLIVISIQGRYMKKLAFLIVLALEFAVGGCGSNTIAPQITNTVTSGNWEAQLTGGVDQASLLNFTTEFSVENTGPLDIKGFSFFNLGKCFANINGSTGSGPPSPNPRLEKQVNGHVNFKGVVVTAGGKSPHKAGKFAGPPKGT